jgi:inner membrane protein
MPTVLTHAAAGVGLTAVCFPTQPPWFWGLAAALAVLPDLDAVGFRFGVRYGSFLGHRGFSHSLLLALLIGLVAGRWTAPAAGVPWWLLGLFFFGVVAGHGLLDGLTNGGMGVAYFSPFDRGRYFLPWRPIRVSAIGLAALHRRTLAVLASELLWVWLPLTVAAAAGWLVRSAT